MNLKNENLNLEMIRSRLNGGCNHSPIPSAAHLKPAAVLLPLVYTEDEEWHLLFTRRTEAVQTHKGQISFPGGAFELSDSNLVETALRETNEEIGLSEDRIHVLGCLEDFPTISDYLITPVVAWIDWPSTLHLAPEEVSRVFTIPIKWLANSGHWQEIDYQVTEGLFRKVIQFEEYDHEILWGITAHLTVEFFRKINLI